jgi:hypothetical protein
MNDKESIFEIDKTKQESKPNILFTLIEEPKLIFSNNGQHEDPKEGIRTFGPYSYGTTAHPNEIKIGFIGIGESIAKATEFCKKCILNINSKNNSLPHLFQKFEGFKELFKSDLIFNEYWNCQITKNELNFITETKTKIEGFNKAINLLESKVKKIAQQDSKPDLLLIIIPKEIEDFYKVVGKNLEDDVKLSPSEKKLKCKILSMRHEGQNDLFGLLLESDYIENSKISQNFRRAFKAKIMKYNLPTQIILSSILNNIGTTKLQDEATFAWNIFTALYYKSGGIPWNLKIEEGTCFVGVSFYKNMSETSFTIHTSLAQVFTDKGDFLILRGAKFNWSSDQGKTPHLDYENSKNLIKQVIDKYKETRGILPKRIVIHKTSKYWPDELKGFLEPLKDIEQYDLVALYSTGVRFLRSGNYPVLRGTYCSIAEQAHFIFTQGYVPYLETFPRNYIPEPLEIVHHIGDSTKKKICEEIIGLSKMNWNNSDFSNKLPITLSFAHKVGEILSYIPEKEDPHPSYKFYM